MNEKLPGEKPGVEITLLKSYSFVITKLFISTIELLLD